MARSSVTACLRASLAVTRVSAGRYQIAVRGLGTMICPQVSAQALAPTFIWFAGGNCGSGLRNTTAVTGDGVDHQFWLLVIGR